MRVAVPVTFPWTEALMVAAVAPALPRPDNLPTAIDVGNAAKESSAVFRIDSAVIATPAVACDALKTALEAALPRAIAEGDVAVEATLPLIATAAVRVAVDGDCAAASVPVRAVI